MNGRIKIIHSNLHYYQRVICLIGVTKGKHFRFHARTPVIISPPATTPFSTKDQQTLRFNSVIHCFYPPVYVGILVYCSARQVEQGIVCSWISPPITPDHGLGIRGYCFVVFVVQ